MVDERVVDLVVSKVSSRAGMKVDWKGAQTAASSVVSLAVAKVAS